MRKLIFTDNNDHTAYYHVESCQETVPEAITAFLEGNNFEDVIRTAVSLGGDCDTLTCIAGGITEAFYGVLEEIAAEGRKRLSEKILAVLDRFTETAGSIHAPGHNSKYCLLNNSEGIENKCVENDFQRTKRKVIWAILTNLLA